MLHDLNRITAMIPLPVSAMPCQSCHNSTFYSLTQPDIYETKPLYLHVPVHVYLNVIGNAVSPHKTATVNSLRPNTCTCTCIMMSLY